MTVHPWPLNDRTPSARLHVWWKRRSDSQGRALLIDGPAVPLRLAPEPPARAVAPPCPVQHGRPSEQLLITAGPRPR